MPDKERIAVCEDENEALFGVERRSCVDGWKKVGASLL